MDEKWLSLISQQKQLESLMETNRASKPYGLVLSAQDAKLILSNRISTLKEMERVEFGAGITRKIIYEFCDSQYIYQDQYVDTIIRLQEIFYLYKNEMLDEITDEELLHFMKEQFETICYGDLEYLESTCLQNFAQAIRAGYGGHKRTKGYGCYEALDEVKRWDYELYLKTLKELCWR